MTAMARHLFPTVILPDVVGVAVLCHHWFYIEASRSSQTKISPLERAIAMDPSSSQVAEISSHLKQKYL